MNLVRPRTPLLSQYCTAIFMATSTATEPDSEKNTRSSPGSAAASRRASVSAPWWTRPPNITWGIASSWLFTAAAMAGWL